MNGQNRQKGFIVIFVAFFVLFVFFVVGGLAIDVSRAYLAKTELQSAVDACALAGARNLYPCSRYNPPPWPLPPSIPNWTSATTTATGFVGNNTVDHRSLSAAEVTPGYWNISTNTFRATTAAALTASDMPAVQVSTAMSSAKGNWAVQAFFAKPWISGFEPGASAIAAVSLRQPIFPYVIGQCVVDDTLSGVRPNNTFDLMIYRGGAVGQWTSLDSHPAGDGQIRKYIDYTIDSGQGSPPPTPRPGDSIVIRASGSVTSNLYDDTASLIAAGKGRVLMPVVACPVGSSPIVTGFAPVQLTSATGGATPTMSGYLYPPQLVK